MNWMTPITKPQVKQSALLVMAVYILKNTFSRQDMLNYKFLPMSTEMQYALEIETVLSREEIKSFLKKHPLPLLMTEQRQKIIVLAVDAVKKIGYVGCGNA